MPPIFLYLGVLLGVTLIWFVLLKRPVSMRGFIAGDTVPKTGDVRQRICEVALVIDQSESVREYVAWV